MVYYPRRVEEYADEPYVAFDRTDRDVVDVSWAGCRPISGANTIMTASEEITDDATSVSDVEEPLVDAFESSDRLHQLNLVHIGRTPGYKLWEDDAFPLSERKAIVSGVTNDLFHLKNSAALHAPRNERLAIHERIGKRSKTSPRRHVG